MRRFRLPVAVLAASSAVSIASAATLFPDVPSQHLYREPIEALAQKGVVKGNPSGKFEPERSVNRAEFLIMLYRIVNWTADASKKKCFGDVEAGSWYENTVCDAVARGIVSGYPNGKFDPNRKVNRVEAVKMMVKVFAVPAVELDDETRGLLPYSDVSFSAWYTGDLVTAFGQGILPIQGQIGARFFPDTELQRGEAAAYLYNAWKRRDEGWKWVKGEPVSSAAASAVSSAAGGRSSKSVQTQGVEPVTQNAQFPFSDDGNFVDKRPMLYRFTLSAQTTLKIDASVTAGIGAKVSCRLYRLADNGFSHEYYLGHQIDEHCSMRVALAPGSYQLDIAPTQNNVAFKVAAAATSGDGNDGFVESKTLLTTQSRTALLEVDDFADWYKFSLAKQSDLTVELTNLPDLHCLIYPLANVDLYGFTGPVCNEQYALPAGDYMVMIGRKSGRMEKVTYMLRLK